MSTAHLRSTSTTRKVRLHAVLHNAKLLKFATSIAGGLPPAPPASLPVFTIVSANDPTCDVAAVEATQQMIPHQKIKVYPNAGHWVMVEAKDELVEDVSTWLSEVLKA